MEPYMKNVKQLKKEKKNNLVYFILKLIYEFGKTNDIHDPTTTNDIEVPGFWRAQKEMITLTKKIVWLRMGEIYKSINHTIQCKTYLRDIW